MSKHVSEDLLDRALGSTGKVIINNVKSSINNKDDNNDNEITDIQQFRHWRDFGSYLDTLKIVNTENDGEIDNSKIFKNLSNKPISQPINYKICNNCGIAILDENISNHLNDCINKKANVVKKEDSHEIIDLDPSETVKKEETPNGDIRSSPKKNGGINNNKKVTKKRKNDEMINIENQSTIGNNKPSEDIENQIQTQSQSHTQTQSQSQSQQSPSQSQSEQPDKKKPKIQRKKKEPKQKIVKNVKNKGPVDVERQCGVPLPNGGFCARSLTCKTHSMGAKRSVLGRSAPYDQLLAAYQRKNQAKIGAAAAAAQQAKDDLMHGSNVAIDDEEETQQVLAGVRRSSAMPFERPVCIPIKMRTGYLRMREMFATNLLPRLQNNPLGKMYARAAVMNVENIGETSFFPVRSQHQKNNQQRQAMKHNQNAIQLQLQKQAQAQAQIQAQVQTQVVQAHAQSIAMVNSTTSKQSNGSVINNNGLPNGLPNVLPNGINVASLTPQQQQQLLLRQAQALQHIPKP